MRQLIRTEAALRRAGIALAMLLLGLPLLHPPGAQAAVTAPPYPVGVALVNDGGADPTLSFLAKNTDDNNVTISLSGESYVVTDIHPVTAGADCTQLDPTTVSCPAASVADIRVNANRGNDTVVINGPVNATLFGREGNDTLIGGDGNDVLDGYLGDDVLDGGGGLDTADYASVPTGVRVDLGDSGPQVTGGAGTDTLSSLENVRGSSGADTLTGDAGANVIVGLGGEDLINSRDGAADQISCGAGTDPPVIADAFDVFVDTSCEQVDNGVAPDTTIDSGPPVLTNATGATLEFSANEAATFQCALDDGAFEQCDDGTVAYPGPLAEGPHTFSVIATDVFGNSDQTPATRDWVIDTAAPDTIVTSPGGTINGSSLTVEFSSADPDVARFECNLDDSNWFGCQSPLVMSGLAEGAHTLAVRAVDAAGNEDPEPATLAFTVVLPPPAPAPTAGAAGVVISRPSPSSLVLIAGRTVRISRTGRAAVTLNCSGTRDCAGRVILATSKPIRYSRVQRRRIVRLGSARFSLPATRSRKVRIKISRKKVRLVRKLRRLAADVTVRDLDRAGRARVSTRTITLRAPR